jgi:hypothetical protein
MASDSHYHYLRAGRIHFFCPLCHHHQSTNSLRRVSLRNIGQLLLLTLATSYLAWPLFGSKGLALFFPYWATFELVYRFRKRQALICQSCGFDPFLYKQDVKRARASLRKHWEDRIQKENLFAGKKLKNYQTSELPTQPVSTELPAETPEKGAAPASRPGSP